jgi:hypothetical protein
MIATEPGVSRKVDSSSFGDRPDEMVWQDLDATLAMPAAEVREIQLAGVRCRLEELRDRLPVLRKLAEEQGIGAIGSLNDAAPLLFKHSVYKSYPNSLVEKGRFDLLTRWLQNLTTEDLSGFSADNLESVDDWLDALLRDAGVRIIHSTGTSGKLSFLPRGHAEAARQLRSGRLSQQVIGQGEPSGLDEVPTIVVGQRHMFNGYGANVEALVDDLYGGDEAKLHVMGQGRLSADVLSLAGRLSAGSDKVDRDAIPASVLARLDEFIAAAKSAPERRAAFFDRVIGSLAGKRVMMAGNWGMYNELMEAGRARGVQRLFAPDSLFLCAGGDKGLKLPETLKQDLPDFLGVNAVNEAYGMSEMATLMPKCSAGKYHALPWMVVFVLDPSTGDPAPREGTHKGRFGVIDLTMQTRWGGVLSGDEVTVTWDKCRCGLDGPFLENEIRRYGADEGGDDKITCAGAPQAHENALEFLVKAGGGE